MTKLYNSNWGGGWGGGSTTHNSFNTIVENTQVDANRRLIIILNVKVAGGIRSKTSQPVQ